MRAPLRILLVEDDERDQRITRDLLAEALQDRFELDWVDTFEAGLEAACSGKYDICLVDHYLGTGTGTELIQEALAAGCRTPTIVLTGRSDPGVDLEAMRAGAADFLYKGRLDAPSLARSLRYSLERFRAEEALRASEERFRTLVENSAEIITVLDENGLVRYHSPSLTQLLGHDPRGLRGKSVLDFIHPEDRPGIHSQFDSLVHTPGGSLSFECRVLDDAGEWRVLDCMARNLAEAPGVRGLLVSSRDVTERRATEAREHAMSRGLRSVLTAADELLQAPDTDHLLRRAVELAREKLGLERVGLFLYSQDRQKLHGTYGTDLAGRTTEERAIRVTCAGLWQRYLEPPTPEDLRWHLQEEAPLSEWREDCSVVVGRGWIAYTPIQSSRGVVGVLCNDSARSGRACDPVRQEIAAVYCSLLGNILELKQATEALQRSESSLAEAQRMAGMGSWSYDPARRTMLCSDTVYRIFGMRQPEGAGTEIPAAEIFQCVHPEDRDGLMAAAVEALSGGRDYRVEHRIVLPDGAERVIAAQGEVTFDAESRPVRLVGTMQDVTEHRRLEDQLRQAQKMEAVGRLAGGVAHDFNNMLAVIAGYSEVLLERSDPADPLYPCLHEIKKASERATSLTRQLLAFSRKQVVAPRPVDVNSVILNVREMLQRLIGEDVRLHTRLTSGLGAVKADPSQLEQVLLNLVVNARDAMPQGGRLIIETSSSRVETHDTAHFVAATAGDYAVISLTDTGTGMDAETISHIFEPFFTTKPVGQGTGLGLATVYAIVEQSGGRVTVESEVGKGSTFRIMLPALPPAPADTRPADAHQRPPTGTETVLMVEDEEMVRRLVRDILQRNGYHVLESCDAEEALRVCASYPAPIHLLVTDVVMPGMSGRELAERVTLARPDMKVLFMSGYTDDAVVRHGVLDVGTSFIQKPFSPLALARQIRQVLEGNGQPCASE